MDIETFVSRAPTRLDLAGGTLDLWPLHLFLECPTTVNLAVDLFAEARLDVSSPRNPTNPEIVLRAEDQGIEQRFSWKSFRHSSRVPSELELHSKFLHFFLKERNLQHDLSLTTRAQSPAGAGLGGSSTLSVAIIGAIASWTTGRLVDPLRNGEELIHIARDVETTVIQVPAGLQDYYGAMFGGLQCLHWGFGSHRRDRLPEDTLLEVGKRILLFYSGQSRNSGINNWALFKSFIDRELEVRLKLKKINDSAQELEAALRSQNWERAGQAIANEWEVRKSLAPGISTVEIDQALGAAKKTAPVAGKVCGAGGGGCFFVYLGGSPSEEIISGVRQAIIDTGMKVLPFRAVPHGLHVQVMHA